MRIRDLRKSDPATEPKPLMMSLQIAKDPGSTYQEVTFLIDTGQTSTAIGLPADLAKQLGIQPINKASATTADGDQTQFSIGEVAIIFGEDGLVVNCAIGLAVPTIGLPLVAMSKFYVERGELKIFSLLDREVNRVPPYQNQS